MSQFLPTLKEDLNRSLALAVHMCRVVVCHSTDVNGTLTCRCLSFYPCWKWTCTEALGGVGGGWISGCGCAYMYCVVACHSTDVNGILACRCLSSYPRWKQTCTEASGADWTPCWDSACTLACLSAVSAPTSAVWWPPSSRGRR